MISALRGSLWLPLFFCSLLSWGQAPPTTPDDQMGVVPYGSYDGGNIDSVSLSTGNLLIRVPMLSYPQRGNLKVEFDLLYNGKPFQWEQCQPQCGYNYNWGGSAVSFGAAVVNSLEFGQGSAIQIQVLPPPSQQFGMVYRIVLSDGSSHLMGHLGADVYDSNSATWNSTGTFNALDATGWQMVVPTSGSSTVINPSGDMFTNLQWIDPNGNVITRMTNAFVWTDTLGRTIPDAPHFPTTGNTTSTGCSGSLPIAFAVSWTPPGYNGGTMTYKYCYAAVPINMPPATNCNQCPGATLNVNFLQSIVLPNSTTWTFEYNDPGDGSTYLGKPINYGSLTKVTIPTGGSISYTYSMGGGTSSYDWISRWVSTRTLNDDSGAHTWKYSLGGATARVTDPLLNDTVHTFTSLGGSFYETKTQYFSGAQSGGNVLKTVATSYIYFTGGNSPNPSCVVPTQIKTTWPNNQVAEVDMTYDAGFSYGSYARGSGTSIYGRVVRQDEYGYGSGGRGALLKTTNSTYAWQSPNLNYSSYLAHNLLDLPSSVQSLDGGGTQRGYTTYGYDESGLQTSGITEQKVAGESFPGNQTSVHRWLSNGSAVAQAPCNVSVASGGYLVTNNIYFDTGEIQKSTDPCLYSTSYQYSSTYFGAYPTTLTNALGQNTNVAYDFSTGLVTSVTDPNLQPTTKTYDIMERLTGVAYPDGGSTTYCYTDFGGVACSRSGPPYEVVATKAINTNLIETSTTLYDGLGRVTQTQLNSDPGGTTYTQTAYDAVGRKSQVYNPTRCSPPTTNCNTETTWGYTTYNYDVLNRVTSVHEQDGSTVSTDYGAFPCTTVTDEVGSSRKSCVDGLGRLTTVWEDSGTTPHLNYETDYNYDALDNLTNVTQKGSDAAKARARNFIYDSLSRLTNSSNPESGAISYGYDADGNVITKKALSPNQPPPGTATVTTTYTYDTLNRLAGKSYNDGYTSNNPTPRSSYAYDGNSLTGCNTTPPTLTDSYPVTRRTSMCDGSGATSWKHDTMGRVLQERRTIGTVKGDYENDVYNLDGSVTSVSTLGYATSYTYGGAGRPTAATHSTTKFVSGATYAPPGELSGLTLGSATGFAGITVANAYNNRLQPILLSAASPSGSVFSECFDFHLGMAVTQPTPCLFSATTLGNNGNVYQIMNNRDNTRTQNFIYDSLNRIQQAYSSGAQWGETFGPNATSPGVAPSTPGIDAWGNLTNRSGVTGKTSFESLNASAGTNNQLSGFGYDPAGNMTSNGSAAYVYDDENRLIATAGYSYLYDGDGQRVEKCTEGAKPGTCATTATGTLYWRGLGSAPLTETDLSGNVQNTYVLFNGERVARSDSAGTIHYYFSDHLGSHGVVESATGSACEQDIDYYPYGGQEHDYCPSIAQNYKFTSKERDSESALTTSGLGTTPAQLGDGCRRTRLTLLTPACRIPPTR